MAGGISSGGFSEGFRRPSIEDIEVGWRVGAAGYRVWLSPDIHVQHLKAWTLRSMLVTDIRDRAVPWSKLIAWRSAVTNQLNLTTHARVSAAAAVVATMLLPVVPFSPVAVLVMGVMLVTVGVLNAGLYRFFGTRGGPTFVGAAIALHFL